jgi:hypothetical protein
MMSPFWQLLEEKTCAYYQYRRSFQVIKEDHNFYPRARRGFTCYFVVLVVVLLIIIIVRIVISQILRLYSNPSGIDIVIHLGLI